MNSHCQQCEAGKFEVASAAPKYKANADGSVDLYIGSEKPEGVPAMWIKTIPGKGWWSVLRIYGPQAASFDGTWKPGDFVEMR
jgi:hypothetical protein